MTQNPVTVIQDFVTGINLLAVGDLLNMLGIVILIYAFYKNKGFNNILLKRGHLLIIISASLLIAFTAVILFLASYPSSFPYSLFVYNDIIGVFGSVSISILLIALLGMLTMYYRRTKNPNTLYIIAGFSTLFLESTFSLTVFVLGNYFNVFPLEWAAPSTVAENLIPLIAYLLFLLALIRARVRE